MNINELRPGTVNAYGFTAFIYANQKILTREDVITNRLMGCNVCKYCRNHFKAGDATLQGKHSNCLFHAYVKVGP